MCRIDFDEVLSAVDVAIVRLPAHLQLDDILNIIGQCNAVFMTVYRGSYITCW